jgi:hypothetical protein
MPLNHLFDIGTRHRGNLVLAIADDEPHFKVRGTAYILDLQAKSAVGKFPVRYERPGLRLALSWDDQVCCIGCYYTYGLAGYCALSGQEAWRRKDLKSVQSVVCSELEDWVFCERENGAAHLVKASTGETLEKLTGVKEVYPSPFDQSVLVAGRSLELHRPFGTKLAKLKGSAKTVNRCGFSHSEFVINELDSVRCFDLNSQELLWTYTLPPKSFLPRICFHEHSGCFATVERHERLLFFEARTGTIKRIVTLADAPGPVYDFCNRGAALFTPSLCLVSTETGAVVEDLATPELLAWDPRAKMDRLRELAESNRSFEELYHYVHAEGFSKADIFRVLFWKTDHDRKQQKT